MKKFIVSALVMVLWLTGYSSTTPNPDPKTTFPIKSSEVYIPVGKTGQLISILDLSQISVKDFEKLTGKKMKLAERVNFKLAQRELRKNINDDGSFASKQFEKYFAFQSKARAAEGGVHIGGLALGFLLFLIGVLIAYLINDDLKASRVKWAWIGAAIGLVFWLLLSLI